jgi:hypothetical protein
VDFACSQCGNRQASEIDCTRCGSDTVHDLHSRRARELFEEIDSRLADRAEGRARFLGVIGGMAIVIAAWFIPGYWEARNMMLALPLFADQWLLMAVIAYGLLKVFERALTRPRFPYLSTLSPADRP